MSPRAADLMPSASFWATRLAGALVLFAASWRLSAIPVVWLQAMGLVMTLALFGAWVWRFVLDRETRGVIVRWSGLAGRTAREGA
jgi:hypothetical protein